MNDDILNELMHDVRDLVARHSPAVEVQFDTSQWFKREVMHVTIQRLQWCRVLDVSREEAINARNNPAPLRSRFQDTMADAPD